MGASWVFLINTTSHFDWISRCLLTCGWSFLSSTNVCCAHWLANQDLEASGDTSLSQEFRAGRTQSARRTWSLASIPARLTPERSDLGIIVVAMIIPVGIRKDSTIPGELQVEMVCKLVLLMELFPLRCFVGEQPDQWRNCSDRYFPVSTFSSGVGGGHVGSATTTITSSISTSSSNKYQTVKRHKNKKGQIYQSPPRPGLGLQSLEDFSAARLWPITYLYKDGPPNSTELSNFVDCKKEGDC